MTRKRERCGPDGALLKSTGVYQAWRTVPHFSRQIRHSYSPASTARIQGSRRRPEGRRNSRAIEGVVPNDEIQEEQWPSKQTQRRTEGTRGRDASETDGFAQENIDSHKPDKEPASSTSPRGYPPYYIPAMNFAVRRRNFAAPLLLGQYTRLPAESRCVMKMMRTRQESPPSLGYPNKGRTTTSDQMIGNGARIAQFIREFDEECVGAQKEFQCCSRKEKV